MSRSFLGRKGLVVASLAVLIAAGAVIGFAASLSITSSKLSVFKPATLPPVGCTPGTQTIVTNRDSFISQSAPNQNNGTGLNLFVRSRSGSQNQRTLVFFTLPSLPSGCSVTSATLRVYNNLPTSGRTVQAIRITASWTENGVTWANQPASTGTAATSATGSSAAYQTWTVTSQVQSMYSVANHGFLLRDATENSGAARTQSYSSREGAPNDPELIVDWG